MQLKPSHVFYLTFMNYSILNLLLLPQMLQTAGRDIWISTLLSALLGLAMSLLLWWGERRKPGKTLFELLEKRLSRVGRIAFFAAMGVYLLAVIIITTTYLAEFVSIGFIQETPFWVIVASFSISVMYPLRKGLGALANLAGVLTFATAISGTTMSLAISSHRDWSNLLPVAEFGYRPILLGALLFFPLWIEVLLLGFLPRKEIGQKVWSRTYFWVVMVNTVLFLGHTIGPISVFGLDQAKNLNFPALSAVKVISLGFVDRFDIYGLALMIFGSFVRVSLYALLLAKMISGGKDPMGDFRVRRWGSLLIGVTLFAGTLLAFQNTVVFDMVVNNFAYGTAAVFVVFLLVYLVLVVH